MRRILWVFASIGLFISSASAQCGKDTDCKGDRVCVNGECVDASQADQPAAAPAPVVAPAPAVAPASPASPPAQIPVENRTTYHSDYSGWGNVGGIIGIIHAPVLWGLYVGAGIGAQEAEKGNVDKAVPLSLGISGLALQAITVPIVSIGGNSSRNAAHVKGRLPLRIISWVLYGGSLGCGVVMAILGAADQTPPSGLILGTGLAGFLSDIFMSVDSFASKRQAREKLAFQPEQPKFRLALTPMKDGAKMAAVMTF